MRYIKISEDRDGVSIYEPLLTRKYSPEKCTGCTCTRGECRECIDGDRFVPKRVHKFCTTQKQCGMCGGEIAAGSHPSRLYCAKCQTGDAKTTSIPVYSKTKDAIIKYAREKGVSVQMAIKTIVDKAVDGKKIGGQT